MWKLENIVKYFYVYYFVMGGAFLPNVQTKFPFDEMFYILRHCNLISYKITSIDIKKPFKTCLLWEPKRSKCYSLRRSHSNDRGKAVDTRCPTTYTRCHCLCGGGAFLPNFQESLFLAWNYTLGTKFVPNA